MQTLKLSLSEFVNPCDIMEYEPMSKHTTFHVGGNASAFVRIREKEQLIKVLSYLKDQNIDYYIVGNGSNLLVGDKGYKGVIIQIGKGFDQIRIEGNRIIAQAGAMLSAVAKTAADAGLTGMEFAAGIPGTIGGGVMMNCGAYDGEMKQVVETVTVLKSIHQFQTLSNTEMEFGYRTSILKRTKDIVTEVKIKLPFGEKQEIYSKMELLNSKRREKQPLEFPSAGSTFKRPEGNFAGKLIMDAGLRGFRVGGACVSEKHCGFIINDQNATAADVRKLTDIVISTVKEKFDVELEPEVIFLGDF